MNTFEPWVLDWVNEQRRKGAKGLEVKYLNKNYYVYRSTSYWDKNLRKVRKKSTYIGRLDRERGLIQSSQKYRSNVYPKSVKTYGDAMLLNIALNDLIPLLKENFDFWEDIYALALVRIYGYVPLNGENREINFLLAVTRKGGIPIHQRPIAGSIPSVSTVRIFNDELKDFGISSILIVMVRGFYSILS